MHAICQSVTDERPHAHVAARLVEPAILDEVVTRLQEIERHNGIERTLAIGELILRQFFGGDPESWQDRRRNKNNSIRRLAARPECPLSKSALSAAVGVYVASVHSPCVRTLGHIGASHVAAVMHLEPGERERVLKQAEAARWSVRELRQNVVSDRRANGERRGRPTAKGEALMLKLARTSVRSLTEALEQARALKTQLEKRSELERIAAEGLRLSSEFSDLIGVLAQERESLAVIRSPSGHSTTRVVQFERPQEARQRHDEHFDTAASIR